MRLSVSEAFPQLFTAVRRMADVGMCNGEYFMQTLSFGLDAAIALGTHERRERTGRQGTRLFLEEGVNQLVPLTAVGLRFAPTPIRAMGFSISASRVLR